MIVRLTGTVGEVGEDSAELERDGVVYEVMLGGYSAAELAGRREREVTLYTLEYYEGNAAGGHLIPRIIGFLRPEERAFYQAFTTVKGMGARRALKALAMPIGEIAAAIEAADDKALSRLPGVGKRVAQQIIAELRGKVGDFAMLAAAARVEPGESPDSWPQDCRDALSVLVALGERPADAQRWLHLARKSHPDTAGSDEWVRLAYQARSLGG